MGTLRIGSSTFWWGSQTYIMGIINATPDSFSGDGLIHNGNWVQQAVRQGIRFAQEGVHLLDVGGESTRPGAESVNAKEELERVLPVIKALAHKVDVPISIDTYKATVAAAALWLIVLSFTKDQILPLFIGSSPRTGPLVASMLLFCVPLALLAMAGPLVIRFLTSELDSLGITVGKGWYSW